MTNPHLLQLASSYELVECAWMNDRDIIVKDNHKILASPKVIREIKLATVSNLFSEAINRLSDKADMICESNTANLKLYKIIEHLFKGFDNKLDYWIRNNCKHIVIYKSWRYEPVSLLVDGEILPL